MQALRLLLSEQKSFTRVWGSQIFSQVGDWFSFVALLALVLELTGSGLHVSFVFLATALPSLLLAPVVGVIADRFDRRRILIAADLVRVFTSAGFLLVRQTDQVWLAYVLLVVGVVANCFFSPCINAAIPHFVKPGQLTLANSLLSGTNGVVGALSAWLGGVVATLLGRDTCFIVDSLSFAVSALAIYSIRQPFSSAEETAARERSELGLAHFASDVAECWRYVKGQGSLVYLLLLKAGAGLGGGVMALLSVVPVQVFGAGDYGVGVLYGARGVGTVLGALAAGACAGWSGKLRFRMVAAGLLATGVFSVLFGLAAGLYVAAAMVLGAFCGNGIQWVLTAALLQQNSEDRFLGRIFALDNFAMTFTASLTALAAGAALEYWQPHLIAWAVGGSIALAGLVALWYAWAKVAGESEAMEN